MGPNEVSRPPRLRREFLSALAAVVVVVVVLAGVSVATGHDRRVDQGQPTRTAAGQGAVLNRQLTTAETIRLVGLIKLPPGSSATSVQPSSLTMPAIGRSASSSLIDTVRYWRIPLPYPQAVSWMARYPPAGLPLGATSGPTRSAKQFSGYLFEEPASSAWEQASLQIGVAPSSSGSTVWRADGLALWLDPRPAPDTVTGPRLHVTVAAGCPSSDRGATDVSNAATGLTASLLPPGSQSAALVCVYSGSNGNAFALTAHRLLSATEAGDLARLARAVSLAHVDNEVISCPLDDGGTTVLVFSYPNESDIGLWLTPGGCGFLSNGVIVAGAFDEPASATSPKRFVLFGDDADSVS